MAIMRSLIECNAIFSMIFENKGSIDSGRKSSTLGFFFFGTGITFAIFHFLGIMHDSNERARDRYTSSWQPNVLPYNSSHSAYLY